MKYLMCLCHIYLSLDLVNTPLPLVYRIFDSTLRHKDCYQKGRVDAACFPG